ncbi:MAG: hypothetical protein NT040_13400 [Bacteroidetes bacterium]|nr:hypothetical protein [Bacteroidota bacterium]
MTIEKKAGIWMDHSSAHMTEFSTGPMETKIIVSEFTHQEKEVGLDRGENHMHIKEQHKQSEYYRKIGEAIRNYDEVLLFGPTDAKEELFNILKEDHLFSAINFGIKQTDKMSEFNQHAFIRQYFTKPA